MQFLAKDTQRGKRFSPEELARELRTTPGTLEFWRATRKGPKAEREGGRVYYTVEAVVAWVNTMPWTRPSRRKENSGAQAAG